MIITDIDVTVFRHQSSLARDSAGHAHPGEPTETRTAMLSIATECGTRGVAFAPPELVRPHVIEKYFRKVAIGAYALNRERIWQAAVHFQRGSGGQFPDRALAILDQALWDLTGKLLDTPVHKLLGGYRDKLPAYASTMCGDDLEGGLATPDDYARFAETLVEKGYKAIKLHTWMPPIAFAPDVSMDIRACEAVREAVGPDIALMLDGYHWYSRTEALKIGRALERLDFAWFEEPMAEDSMESYVWLSDQLDIPVIGPETIAGKFFSRASWVKHQACDILRAGVDNTGGISPCMKVAHLAEAFNMDCEIHGNGAANLAVAGAIRNCRWYERGLLHPFLDYEQPPEYLKHLVDPIDADGNVHLSGLPGLGEDIDFEFIACNSVEEH